MTLLTLLLLTCQDLFLRVKLIKFAKRIVTSFRVLITDYLKLIRNKEKNFVLVRVESDNENDIILAIEMYTKLVKC